MIGPENSELKCRKFGTCFGQSTDCLGGFCDNLCNKLWFGCYWGENGHGFRFHKLEPMLGERASHRQPITHLGTVKNNPGFLDGTENGPCVL